MTKPIQGILSLLIAVPSSIAILFFFQPIRNTSWAVIAIVTLAIMALYYSFFSGYVRRGLNNVSSIKRKVIYVFTFFYSIAFLLSIKGEQSFLADNSIVIKGFVYLGFFAVIYFGTLLIISWLLQANLRDRGTITVSKANILLYALPSFVVWSFFLIAVYPAAMTPDSLSQWYQAHTGEFNDWHPIVYTWFIMFLNLFWDSPAVVGVAQILIMGLIMGYGLYRFEKFGLNKIFLWTTALVFALIPINGIFAVTIWKDILYSIFLFFFSIIMFNIVATKGKWLNSKSSMALYFLGAFGLVFLRHNGFPIFIVLTLVMLVLYREQFKRLFSISAFIIALHFILTGPVFSYLNVIPSDPNEALSIPTQQLGTVIASDGELTREQTDYLDQILSVDLWKERFNPYNTNPIKFSKEYNRKAIQEQRDTYFKTWAEAGMQNPLLYVKGYLKQTSLVWQMNEPADGYTDTFVTNLYPNTYGIKSETVNFDISLQIKKWLNYSDTTLTQIIWRPANYLFFVLLFTFAAAIKVNWRLSLVMLPVFLNVGTILAGLPAQDFRYMYPVILVSFLAVMLPFVRWNEGKNLE